MERRKLFGNSRRALFSESPKITRRKLFSKVKTIVCHDCGYEMETNSVTNDIVCPNCGSNNRFIEKYGDVGQENVIEKGERRSLFSSLTRRQPNRNGEGQDNKADFKRLFRCYDCNTEFPESGNTARNVRCPHCGGNRVQMLGPVLPNNSMEAEQHEYSDATDEFLKEFSGKTVNPETLQKLFAERGIDKDIEYFCNSGYASLNDEGQVCFSEDADYTRKLFSQLVISVTKELHLVPVEDRKEELIHELENRGNISPKGIILIKKAHGMIPTVTGCCPIHHEDSYIKDSGLANDLKLEYGVGHKLPIRDFMNKLDTQYNDAPDNILDKLVDSGAIRILGSHVEVL